MKRAWNAIAKLPPELSAIMDRITEGWQDQHHFLGQLAEQLGICKADDPDLETKAAVYYWRTHGYHDWQAMTPAHILMVLEADAEAPPATDKPEAPLPAFDPATEQLLLNGRRYSLEDNEVNVLRALVGKGALQLGQLRNQSGCDKANQVLSNLRRKYPALKKHIILPGRKGRGGYSTTIRPTP